MNRKAIVGSLAGSCVAYYGVMIALGFRTWHQAAEASFDGLYWSSVALALHWYSHRLRSKQRT